MKTVLNHQTNEWILTEIFFLLNLCRTLYNYFRQTQNWTSGIFFFIFSFQQNGLEKLLRQELIKMYGKFGHNCYFKTPNLNLIPSILNKPKKNKINSTEMNMHGF